MGEPVAGLRGRILRAFTSSIYGRAVVLVGQVGAVPLLATGWGRAGYGEWVALTAAASYAAYGGMGLAPTVRADMAMAHARAGDEAMRPTFQTAFLFLGAVGLAILAAVLLITARLPIADALRLSTISAADAAFILRMLTLQIVIGLLNGVLLAALGAAGRFAFANTADATRQALEFAAVAGGVGLLRLSAREVSVIYAVSAAAMFAFNLAALGRAAPAVLTGAWRPRREVLARIWRPTLGVLTLNFGYNGLMVQAPRVIMASMVGPAAVASYAVCVMLLRIVRIPLEVPGVSLTVEISRAFGAGDLPFVRRMLTLSTRATFWLALLAAPFVVGLGPTVIHLWSNGRLVATPTVLAILTVSTCAYAAGLPSLEALISANRLMRPSAWLLALAGPFLAACWLGARNFGVEGAAAAVAAFELVMAGVMLQASGRTFSLSRRDALAMLSLPSIGQMSAFALRRR